MRVSTRFTSSFTPPPKATPRSASSANASGDRR
jgi:hypothetical protein